MRPLHCPLPRGLYEICTRITGNELLMVPTQEVTELILGVIGRAQTQNPVDLHAFVFLSNHYHMLVSVPDGKALSKFMQFVNGNIARELNIINDRDGSAWERRFRAIPVAADEATQVWRLRYLLAHGTKENLVGKVGDWPGASSLPWLRDGTTLRGRWVDRTAMYYAKRRKGYVETPGQFDVYYELQLTVLPCWAELPASEWRALVRDIIAELQAETYERTSATGLRPLGRARVLAQDPFSRVLVRHGRAPSVLCLDRALVRSMRAEARAREAAWREAAERAMTVLAEDAGEAHRRLPAMFWQAIRA